MNRALLAKWWWRFRVDSDALWSRVIKSIFGEEGGFGAGESVSWGGRGSVWKNIVGVGACLDGSGINFSNSFRKVVGGGGETRFWKDCWLGDRPFEIAFPRISRLALDSMVSILEKGGWEEDSWTWKWCWSREPRGRALGELENLERWLEGWKPVRDKKDSWGWEFDLVKGFSVHKLREILADLGSEGGGGGETVWVPFVPKKINIFRWRLSRGRIPTRVALDKWGIDLDSVLCPRCGEEAEDIDHVFLKCGEAKRLWHRVGNWWNKPIHGIDSVDHFLQEDADLARTHKKQSMVGWGKMGIPLFDVVSKESVGV